LWFSSRQGNGTFVAWQHIDPVLTPMVSLEVSLVFLVLLGYLQPLLILSCFFNRFQGWRIAVSLVIALILHLKLSELLAFFVFLLSLCHRGELLVIPACLLDHFLLDVTPHFEMGW